MEKVIQDVAETYKKNQDDYTLAIIAFKAMQQLVHQFKTEWGFNRDYEFESIANFIVGYINRIEQEQQRMTHVN